MGKKIKCAICGTGTERQVCSAICCVEYWERYVAKKSRAMARRVAKMAGYRSMGEVKCAAHLESLNVKFDYEPQKFSYIPPARTYLPDFRLQKRKGKGYLYIEYKGILTGPNRTTLLLVKRDHPDLDIRLVFEKPYNKLNKKSTTTYADWAEKYGIPWADKEIPKSWLKE